MSVCFFKAVICFAFRPLCIFFCLTLFWLFIDFSIFSSCKTSTADAAVPLKLLSGGNDFNHQENQRQRERERNNSFSLHCNARVARIEERGEFSGSGLRFDPATPARRKWPDGERDEPRQDGKDLQPKVALASGKRGERVSFSAQRCAWTPAHPTAGAVNSGSSSGQRNLSSTEMLFTHKEGKRSHGHLRRNADRKAFEEETKPI